MNFTNPKIGDIEIIKDNDSTPIICPEWTQNDSNLVEAFQYWLGGVAVCCLSVPGILVNAIAIYILYSKVSIYTTFNSLLIGLFTFDSLYLVFETIETFRRRFHFETRLHLLILPKFTYPMIMISLSASIFMTVGVAHERYDAIKDPIRHRQLMTSAKYRRKKIILYILIVCFLAFGFNIPKFFEVELKWENDTDISSSEYENR